jgi:hypothetical protein
MIKAQHLKLTVKVIREETTKLYVDCNFSCDFLKALGSLVALESP